MKKREVRFTNDIYIVFFDDDQFVVLLGDDIVYSPEKPAVKQLIDVKEQ